MMQALFEKLDDPLTAGWHDVLKVIASDPSLELINAASKAKDVRVVDTRS